MPAGPALLRQLYDAAVAAADPARTVPAALPRETERLTLRV